MCNDKVLSQVSKSRPGAPNSVANPNETAARCLILACGNTLREDDGIGPFLAQWAEVRWRNDERVRVMCDHQWTPEVVEDVASADSIIFVDCATDCDPGLVRTMAVKPAADNSKMGTHHLDAAQLLALSQQYYGRMPRSSLLLTVGAGSLELREGFSEAVESALPKARQMLDDSVQRLLDPDQRA
jgi:hydrogenase maturation protease